MPSRPFLLLFLTVAACGPKPTTPATIASNTSEKPAGWSPTLEVNAQQVVGWLGVAPGPESGDPRAPWAPQGDATAYLVDAAEEPNVALQAVPARGEPEPVAHDARGQLPYGCEQNALDVFPLHGAAPFAPGAVWVLPTDLPDGWHPAGVDLRETEAGKKRRAWTAGALGFSLTALDDSHATLEIRAGDRVLYSAPEETYWMDGADPQPLDLTDFAPGVAMPSAVYLLAPDGPALVVLQTQGFEGWTLTSLLVGADGAEETLLSVYLYVCAF